MEMFFFFRAVTGYRMTDHKHSEDITEELGIPDINTIMKNYKKWLVHLKIMLQNQIQKLFYQYKQKSGRCQGCPTKRP